MALFRSDTAEATRLAPASRAHGRLALVLLALTGAAAGIGFAVDPVAGESAPSQSEPAVGAFGFVVGESREYRLAPESALSGAEHATWTIELDRVVDGTLDGSAVDAGRSVDDFEAVFTLTHERSDRVFGNLSGSRSHMVLVEGELRLNRHGFPLQLEFSERQLSSGEQARYAGAPNRIRYTYRDRKIHKELEFGGREWDFEITPVRHGTVDARVPSGVFVFMPSALGCLLAGVVDTCDWEPAFANPGLLSLALLPMLDDESGNQRDFVFFKPIGFGGNPVGQVNVREWSIRERDTRANYDRYFDINTLKLGESTTIELGDRQLHAWQLDVEGPMRRVYLEPSGRILRVDLQPSERNSSDQWIELTLPESS